MSLITPDFGLLFWMTLIFAIVFFILAKFGFPLITGMVRERAESINASISEAKAACEAIQGLEERKAQLIEEARAEQGRILKETAQTRDSILQEAREQASREAAQLVAQARTQIEAEKESALRDIRREVALLSVSIAEKVLSRDLSSDQAQMDYIARMVDEVSKADKLN